MFRILIEITLYFEKGESKMQCSVSFVAQNNGGGSSTFVLGQRGKC